MERIVSILLLCFVIANADVDPKFKKHSIDVNPDINDNLFNSGTDIVAEIGQYLEITCPQYDQAYAEDKMRQFLLYQFDEKTIKKCHTKQGTKVLSCNTPYKSTKLTIKFQKTSPYPLGFTFKEGKTYYYVAIPLGEEDCTNAVTLKVQVKKPSNVVVPPIKTVTKLSSPAKKTTTTKPTTTTKSTTRKSTIITKMINSGAIHGNTDTRDDGNAASTPRHLIMMTSFLALLTLWLHA